MSKDTTHAPDIMDLELLTPGSVWTRINGKQSRYLFTTNTSLPASHQDAHPQMAVYADEEDNIFSVPVSDFIAKRTFFNVDPSLESRLGNLLALDPAEDTEFTLSDDAEDTLVVEDNAEEASDTGSTMAMVDEAGFFVAKEAPNPITFVADNAELSQVIDAAVLSEHAVGYQQQPMISEQKILHSLFFRATDGITHDTLYASFSPSHKDQNALFNFKVATADGELLVDWDALLGIYPYIMQQDDPMYQVMFTSGMELRYVVEPGIDFKVTTDETTGQSVISAVQETPVQEAAPEVVVDTALAPEDELEINTFEPAVAAQ